MAKFEVTSCDLKLGTRYLPHTFTEHGVTMLASVLKSETAIQMNIAVVRAFIALRETALRYSELSRKLEEIEQTTQKHFKDIYQAINYLPEKSKKKKISANARELDSRSESQPHTFNLCP